MAGTNWNSNLTILHTHLSYPSVSKEVLVLLLKRLAHGELSRRRLLLLPHRTPSSHLRCVCVEGGGMGCRGVCVEGGGMGGLTD